MRGGVTHGVDRGEASFQADLLALWDAATITGVVDGATVASLTDSTANGNNALQATSGKRALYRATGWNGGPCIEFDGTDDHYTCDALGALYGAGGSPFTVAILMRSTSNGGGCCFGFGSNGGVFAQHHIANSRVAVTTTGGANTVNTSSPAWMHVWVPNDGSPVAQDALVIWSCDPSTRLITGAADNGSGGVRITVNTQGLAGGEQATISDVAGTTEANGQRLLTIINDTHADLLDLNGVPVPFANAFASAGKILGAGAFWMNGHRYALNTGTDTVSTYQNFTVGGLIMAGTLYNPIAAKVRAMAVKRGLASDRWIASCVEHFGRRDLQHLTINVRGDSIPINAVDSPTTPWPARLTLTASEVGRKAAQSAPATLVNASVGGTAIADVGTAWPNGEGEYRVFDPWGIYGVDANGHGDVLGLLGVDENGDANYDPWLPNVVLVLLGRHEIDRGFTARATADRYWRAVDKAKRLMPRNYFVVAPILYASIPGVDESVTAAANAFIRAEWRAHADDYLDTLAPALSTPAASGFLDDGGGSFVHLDTTGRTAEAAFVQPQLPGILSRARARHIRLMMGT